MGSSGGMSPTVGGPTDNAEAVTDAREAYAAMAMQNPQQVSVDIKARREWLGNLAAERESQERELIEARAEYSHWAEKIAHLKDAMARKSQERATLLRELDTLLQIQARLENSRQGIAAPERTPPTIGHRPSPPPPPHESHMVTPQEAADASLPMETSLQVSEVTEVAEVTEVNDVSHWAADPDPMAESTRQAAVPPPRPQHAPIEFDVPPPAPPASVAPAESPALRPAFFNVAPPSSAPRPPPAPANAGLQLAAPPPRPLPQSKAPKQAVTPKDERRRQARVPLAVEVDFRSENNLYVGFSENISEGGLFIATYEPLTVGERLPVHFTLPGFNVPIRCEVEVTWVLEYGEGPLDGDKVPGMGLRFLDLPDSHREVLAAFINQREPLFYPG